MIYTEPILRYLVSEDGSDAPMTEGVVWAYAPDHPLAVALPDAIFAIYAATMIENAADINANLRAEFDADMKAWLKMDEESRPEQPTLRHAELPINGWVLADGNWMVDGDPADSHDIYNMPARKGWRFADAKEYDAALSEWTARNEAENLKAQTEGLKHRQSEWDIKADVYRKVGLTDGDIVVVLGERPGDDEQPVAKKGKR
jgi:hypothetical protein